MADDYLPEDCMSARSSETTRTNMFQPSCAHGNHMWPRFDNAHELLTSPWVTYFMGVYGEVPTEEDSFPICTFDFWHIDRVWFRAANISAHSRHVPIRNRRQRLFDDRWYNWTDGELYVKRSTWSSY